MSNKEARLLDECRKLEKLAKELETSLAFAMENFSRRQPWKVSVAFYCTSSSMKLRASLYPDPNEEELKVFNDAVRNLAKYLKIDL